MTFRYIHFWQSHNTIAINKKWYPQEIRAVKVFSNVLNACDAQSFQGMTKIYHSDAHIYHYGHVRDQKAYNAKVQRQIQYHHGDNNFNKFAKKWKSKDRKTVTLNFYGTHPQIMHSRIQRLGGEFSLNELDQVYIYDVKGIITQEMKKIIKAKNIILIKSPKELSSEHKKRLIILDPRLRDQILLNSKVPRKMYSKLSRPWTNEFYLKMKLFEKRIGTYN